MARGEYGIDNDNDVVGYYQTPAPYDYVYGFVLSGVTATHFQFASGLETYAQGINDFGQIVGGYIDANEIMHMFVATSR